MIELQTISHLFQADIVDLSMMTVVLVVMQGSMVLLYDFAIGPLI